jgi:hypothetical protein
VKFALVRFVIFLLLAVPVSAADWFVSPGGTPQGSGVLASPWDLATASSGAAGRIKPGDTVWLRGGKYTAPTPNGFTFEISGTPEKPIVFRNYQNERVTLDGYHDEITLTVKGRGYLWFWGIEVMDSNPTRTIDRTAGAHPNAYGIATYAPGTRFINCVIHDTAEGISAYDASEDSEFYGNLIYYNGFVGPDRNHGHGAYLQNIRGRKLVSDNIVGDNFDQGFQIYGSGTANIIGFRITGNASYNNGSYPSPPHYQYNFLIAGGAARRDIQFDSNYSFHTPDQGAGGYNVFGLYTMGQDMTITNSVFAGGYPGPTISMQEGPIQFTGNRIYMDPKGLDMARLEMPQQSKNPNRSGWIWDNNQYYGLNRFFLGTTDGQTPSGTQLDFNVWKSSTGYDKSSSYRTTKPAGPWIYIRPNRYEPKRANVIIYNWDILDSVEIDLSTVLRNGDPYVIQDAENFYGHPVAHGTYAGAPVKLPMRNLVKAAAIGFEAPPHTGPLFGVFVVMSPKTSGPN